MQARVAFALADHVCCRRDGSSRDAAVLLGINGQHRPLSGAEYLELVYATGSFSHPGIFYNRRIAIENDCCRANIISSSVAPEGHRKRGRVLRDVAMQPATV